MQISWRQEVQKPALHRWELQDFLLLPPFLLQKIRKDVPFLLTKGYGATSDAYHITSPAEDGQGAARCMENAIREAGVELEKIEYINAHGTSTHHNDLFETRAIKSLFKDHAKELKINSTKSMIGHLLGAAGAVEFIACVKELEEGYLHKTAGYKVPDEECDLDYITENGIEKRIEYALSNSLGFGGHNASLLIKRFE